METLFQAMADVQKALEAQGAPTEEATRRTRLLAEAALEIDTLKLLQSTDRPLENFPRGKRFKKWSALYVKGCPLSRLQNLGHFADEDFVLNEETLDPRTDTETLINVVFEKKPLQKNQALRILELGVGSGCILLTLLKHYPEAQGIGTDISAKALDATKINGKRLNLQNRLQLFQGDWFQALPPKTEPFDLIVSNPPYIATQTIQTLELTVRNYDPFQALDGGKDGLNAYRVILADASRFLKPEGWLILEIGFDQGQSTQEIAQRYFKDVNVYPDASGRDRVLCAQEPKT